MSETERKSQTEDVTESTSVTRWSAERLNEVLHRLIKSTKATKIYRDDRTFTFIFLKLEISVLERKTKCSVRIIPGLGEGGEIKKKTKKKTKKKANHPIHLHPQSLHLRHRRRPHLWKERRVFKVSGGRFGPEETGGRTGRVPEEWIALLRFCITSIRAPTMPDEGAAAGAAESVVSSLCRETTVRNTGRCAAHAARRVFLYVLLAK